MINFDDVAKQNIKEHNPNWPQISDQSLQNINNWRLWTWKNKFFFLSNKSAIRY